MKDSWTNVGRGAAAEGLLKVREGPRRFAEEFGILIQAYRPGFSDRCRSTCLLGVKPGLEGSPEASSEFHESQQRGFSQDEACAVRKEKAARCHPEDFSYTSGLEQNSCLPQMPAKHVCEHYGGQQMVCKENSGLLVDADPAWVTFNSMFINSSNRALPL